MMLTHHPAPGLGDLLPGFFVVPQNPIKDAAGVTYVPKIGEILPGSFVVPQNPIKDYMAGQIHQIGRQPGAPSSLNGISGCGCGGSWGGGGSYGSCGCSSMGLGDISADLSKISADFSTGNYTQIFSDTIFGVPVWAVAGGLALLFFAGGEGHSYYGRSKRASRAARAAFA